MPPWGSNPPSVMESLTGDSLLLLPVGCFPAPHQKHKKCTKKHRYRESRRKPQPQRRRRPPTLKRYAGDVLAPVSTWDQSALSVHFIYVDRIRNNLDTSKCLSLPFRVISGDFRSTRWEQAPPPAPASAPSHTLWLTLTLRRVPWCLWPPPLPSSQSEGTHGTCG